MEIHAPEHPIITWKQFLIHIGTVTIGILIALSLEGLLEWNHHRHLVAEARENIRTEMEDNLHELTSHRKNTDENRNDAGIFLHWIADVQKTHHSSIKSLRIGFSRAELNNTSWATAQSLGALALMPYAEVKRNAEVYQLQQEFMGLQAQGEDATILASTFMTGIDQNPENMSPEDLRSEKLQVQRALTAINVQDQLAVQLLKRYETYLRPANHS